MTNGMGSHEIPYEGTTNDWITPPEIIEELGPFDLDPCSSVTQPWPCAKGAYTEGGLEKEWFGRVWLNPPYGPHTGKWLEKLAEHGNGVALIFARTETVMFYESVWKRATGILFLKGRLFFYRPNGEKAWGNAGAPSCLVAYGEENWRKVSSSSFKGARVYKVVVL